MGSRYAIPWRWLLYRTTFENGANPDIKITMEYLLNHWQELSQIMM